MQSRRLRAALPPGKIHLASGGVQLSEYFDVGDQAAVQDGHTRETVLAASSIAGARICEKDNLPQRATASAQVSTTDGTHAGR